MTDPAPMRVIFVRTISSVRPPPRTRNETDVILIHFCDMVGKMSANSTPLLFKASLTWRQRIGPAARYHWKNDQRGGNRYVILQQTLSGYGTFEELSGRKKNVRPGYAFVAIVPEK